MAHGTELQSLMEQCAREEEELQFESFSNAEALQLGLAMLEHCRAAGHSVTIDIERNGQQLFHVAMEGTAPDNDIWIGRKKRLVNRIFKSSYHYFLWLESRGQTLHDRGMDGSLYAASGGGFPVRVRGAGVVGAVTVSGLPHEQDHALVVDCLRRFLAG